MWHREGEASGYRGEALLQGLVGVRACRRWELVLEQACSLAPAPAPPCILSPTPLSVLFPIGGTLVWHDNTAVNYSNWGPPGLGPSMLSHNSCYWIQSSSGLWRPGACTNITMGVVCKLPRGECAGRRCAQPPAARPVLGLGQGPASHSAGDTADRRTGGREPTGPGAARTLPWDKLVCRRDWPFLQISKLDSKPIIL